MLPRFSFRRGFAGIVALALALSLSACTSQTIRYGPFTIPDSPQPGSMETAGELTQTITGIQKPCSSCSIMSFVPKLTYADGSEANWNTDVMLHHAVWSSSARSDVTCPNWPERFFASGNERTPIVLPQGYGYKVASGDSWSMLVDLMNMSADPQTVYIDVTYGFGAASDQAVTPIWLDINNCSNSEYTIPAGFSDTHRDFRAPWNGQLVAMGGHLHDDGVFIETTDQTTGNSLCKSTAGYGSKPSYQGHIESMTICVDRPVGTFNNNDLLRLHSVYDSPMSMNDVMGIMLGYAVRTP